MVLAFIQLLYPQIQLNELGSLFDYDFFLCLDQSLSKDDHLSITGFGESNIRLYSIFEILFGITCKCVFRVNYPNFHYQKQELDVQNDVQLCFHFLYLLWNEQSLANVKLHHQLKPLNWELTIFQRCGDLLQKLRQPIRVCFWVPALFVETIYLRFEGLLLV